MDAERTIVAVASPPGASARGIVRTSGPCAWISTHSSPVALDGPGMDTISTGIGGAASRATNTPRDCRAGSAPTSARMARTCAHAPGNPLLLERIVDAVIAAAQGG
ncbi:MAG: hypothetical protein ACKOFI_02870, partial [Phycisphaerales bacterium]